MEKLKNILLYAGVDRESYDRVKPNILRTNRMMIAIFSGIATVLIGIMCLLTFVLRSTAPNRTIYIAGFFGSLFLFLLFQLYAKNHSWIVLPIVYVAFSIFFLYGLFIGTITNPTQQTVTFMVMLVLMPILFIDRPIRILFAMLFFILIFIYLCFQNKTGAVLSTDVMDAVIYGILGAASGTIINHVKVRSYVLEYKLHDASRFDQLTNMNNRNSYEADMSLYPDKCQKSLTCIYIDVNGLHELNNTKGHVMGDNMLKFVAEQVRNTFGVEYTYRIGGDEFVAFAVDTEVDEISQMLEGMNEIIEKENYHVAIGYHCMDKESLVMDELIKSAESEMYRSKSRFYRESNRDRRNRN